MSPRFQVLATDYDGTLAHDGQVDKSTLAALERVRASGRCLFLVTGREIEDLKRIFSELDLFQVVVGENGALLYYPADRKLKLLHEPPPPRFAEELRARGVSPLSLGHVIVASREPYDSVILEVIKQQGLELEIIFNKGSVMVLPSGVNKATGLAIALAEHGFSPKETVAIGDAENDHSFLRLCGCGVAVSNALPSLKATADLVTAASHGDGVVELAHLLISTDLQGLRRHGEEPLSLSQDPRVLSRSGADPREAP